MPVSHVVVSAQTSGTRALWVTAYEAGNKPATPWMA